MTEQHIYIPKHVYGEMIAYCASQLPHEACGILIGEIVEDAASIHSFSPLLNVDSNPRHRFTIDQAEWTRHLFRLAAKSKSIIGLVHSHPSSAPTPSSADLATEWHTICSHWIISYIEPCTPAVAAYRFLSNRRFQHLSYTLTG